MAGKQEIFDKILEKLDDIQGALGCAIVSRDGTIVASRIEKKYAPDKIAALSSQVTSQLTEICKSLNFGDLDNMILEGDNGKLGLIKAERGGFFILLIGTSDMNIGMARISLQEAIEAFDKAV